MLPLAQAEAAAAGIGAVVILLAAVFALLLFIAPLGIWNRLIKIHRDLQASEKAAAERHAKALSLLAQLVAISRDKA